MTRFTTTVLSRQVYRTSHDGLVKIRHGGPSELLSFPCEDYRENGTRLTRVSMIANVPRLLLSCAMGL
jgi:hypothetical protein